VAMPDRRSAPIFAAAAAFVLVLVFGKVIGSNSASPSPNTSGSPTPTATSSSSSPTAQPTSPASNPGTVPASQSAQTKLTVQATASANATSGVPITGIPVEVAQDKRHGQIVAQGILVPEGVQDSSFMWAMNLPAATYQVCVQPPGGTKVVGLNTDARPGWFCTKFTLGAGSALVTFNLARAS